MPITYKFYKKVLIHGFLCQNIKDSRVFLGRDYPRHETPRAKVDIS